jgi:uncharacterized membrane protein
MTESFFKNDTPQMPAGKIPELSEDKHDLSATSEKRARGFSSEDDRMAAILSYIPLLCFIPLLNMRENKEVRFHARQGVLLFLIELVTALFLIDGVSHFVFRGILIVAVALSVAGIYYALQGKSQKLPIIGDLAEKTKL